MQKTWTQKKGFVHCETITQKNCPVFLKAQFSHNFQNIRCLPVVYTHIFYFQTYITWGQFSPESLWRETYASPNTHRVQFSSAAQSYPPLCDPMDCSTPGLPVYHQLPEFTQTHVHQVSDAIQQSHPLTSPSPLAFNLYHHQGLFKWVSSLHQVAKVLEFQL